MNGLGGKGLQLVVIIWDADVYGGCDFTFGCECFMWWLILDVRYNKQSH